MKQVNLRFLSQERHKKQLKTVEQKLANRSPGYCRRGKLNVIRTSSSFRPPRAKPGHVTNTVA